MKSLDVITIGRASVDLYGAQVGGRLEDAVKLGVIVELIHMATLVHDDIIDGATTRRMVPTANALASSRR